MAKEAVQSDQKTFTLTNDETGESMTLPVHEGTAGPPVIDVRRLYAETGHFTFDPSFTSTGSCKSRLTFIDGEEGVLMHRGYTIEELAEHSTFLEVAYLLLYGDLPNEGQMSEFDQTSHTTRWFTNRLTTSSAVSVVTRIRWQLCVVLSAHYPRSTTTLLISGILNNAKSPLTV